MLQKMNESEFDSFFSILETSFPTDEYRPYAEQKTLLGDEKYSIYVLPDKESGELKAFITVWRFEDFSFIEHFAVHPKYRNHGLGARVLQEIKELFGCRLCLEAELPDTDFAKRRIGFYERNGFFTNPYAYVQPPYSKGKSSVPLIVMTTGGTVTNEDFEKIKETIYREVYRV